MEAKSLNGRVAQASVAAEKLATSHSEGLGLPEESLFPFMELNRREILRFAQNDKVNYFFRSLVSLRGLVAALSLVVLTRPHRPACRPGRLKRLRNKGSTPYVILSEERNLSFLSWS